MGLSALCTVNSDPHGALNDLLSMLAAEEFARPSIRSVTVEVSGITMGRMVRLWGAIGATTKHSHMGATMGPPTLSE